jgi:hypothetical protein
MRFFAVKVFPHNVLRRRLDIYSNANDLLYWLK